MYESACFEILPLPGVFWRGPEWALDMDIEIIPSTFIMPYPLNRLGEFEIDKCTMQSFDMTSLLSTQRSKLWRKKTAAPSETQQYSSWTIYESLEMITRICNDNTHVYLSKTVSRKNMLNVFFDSVPGILTVGTVMVSAVVVNNIIQ